MIIIIILFFQPLYFNELKFDIQGRNFALTYFHVGTPAKNIPVILSTYTDKLIFINNPGTMSYDINSFEFASFE